MADNNAAPASTSECPICLDDLKNPVSTPCGHLSCEECLNKHIEGSHDPYKSTCPTCREDFPIVTPDLARVPDKYKPFVQPSIRRVYLPGGDNTTIELKKELDGLYARIAKLNLEKEQLAQRNKDTADALDRFRQGEKDARSQVKAAKREVEVMRRNADGLRHELQNMNKLVRDRDILVGQSTADANSSRIKYEEMKAKYHGLKARMSSSGGELKRKSSNMESPSSPGSSSVDEEPLSRSTNRRVEMVNDRPTVRIPKRPRLGDSTHNPLRVSASRFMDIPGDLTSGGGPLFNGPHMPGGDVESGFEGFASSSRRSVPPAGGSNAPPIFRPSAPAMPMMRYRGPTHGAFDGAFDMAPPVAPQYHNDRDHPDELDWLEEIDYVNPWGVGARNIRSPGLMPRN
ncbi:unnamed protein product [Peniophora sp. CBMAI 1063]|nr:unnamed protein product [Peniophora sp. CBMAI 1063]